jgi:predicted patatin/cPLA2 family phospholipase
MISVHRTVCAFSGFSRSAKALASALMLFAIAGCAGPERLGAVPPDETVRALPLGLANARFFPATQSAELIAEGRKAVQRQRQALGLAPHAAMPPAQFLAISGGGDDGAFGSGLLVGWSDAGNRPEFQLVTGVSTGALIAPLAFLGGKYDRQLRDVYTTISAGDIYEKRFITSAFLNDALSDTTPLWRLISHSVDEKMMADIATEYRKGRLLVIGTTDLDAQRPCFWNIGAIADSGRPGALDLIRQILRASSAVPGMFQPVLIDVELDGRKYQELHVDGGAIAQMFLYPPNIALRDQPYRERKAYLILNARENPEWTATEPRTLTIVGRAISTMIKYSGTNDILRIYYTTRRDGVDYNLAYIGDDFTMPHPADDFDKAYMNAEYDYAYQKARHGYPWKKEPPGLVPERN